jgi:hypothetical protein
MNRLFSCQFILNASEQPPFNDWVSVAFEKQWLHAAPDLEIVVTRTKDNKNVILLGLAFHNAKADFKISEGIPRYTGAELIADSAFWAGRWLLIIERTVVLDASGLLGVFYHQKQPVLSSSLALLARSLGLEGCRMEIIHGLGIDWYAGPSTRYAGVRRLLPSQNFCLESWQVEGRNLLLDVVSLSNSDPVLLYEDLLLTACRNIAALGAPVYLPLTAGFDSRTILAAAVAAGLRPVTFTMVKPDLSRADLEIPPKIAASLGLSHILIEPRSLDSSLRRQLDEHTAGNMVDADRDFISKGQWDSIPKSAIVLRGGCFEFGKAYFDQKISSSLDIAAITAPLKIQNGFGPAWLSKRQPLITKSLVEWLRWVGSAPEPNLDFRDRFYLEQRLGGWLADVEQALDITGTIRVHVANSRLAYSIMNTASRADRKAVVYQKKIISRLNPGLIAFPFNQVDPINARVRRVIKWRIIKILDVFRLIFSPA